MIRNNFNRSVNFLLISISLIVTGCSDTPKEPLSINDQAPATPAKNESYVYHPYRTLRKHKFNKTASTHKNTVWERLLSLYSLPDIKNPRIDHELYWYLEHPTSLAILQQRAEPYLPYSMKSKPKYTGRTGFVPVVGAFVPDACSKPMLQDFGNLSLYGRYGLQQNDWYDGRRDIYASAKAATLSKRTE
jgi:membrane-bound lytic murein transglycosylase D